MGLLREEGRAAAAISVSFLPIISELMSWKLSHPDEVSMCCQWHKMRTPKNFVLSARSCICTQFRQSYWSVTTIQMHCKPANDYSTYISNISFILNSFMLLLHSWKLMLFHNVLFPVWIQPFNRWLGYFFVDAVICLGSIFSHTAGQHFLPLHAVQNKTKTSVLDHANLYCHKWLSLLRKYE